MTDIDYPDDTGRLSAAEAEQLTVHLAELAGADLPLGPGLRAAAEECRSGRLARALRTLAARIDQGKPLDAAVSAFGRKLPPHVVRLVQAASQSGRIGPALSELLEHHRASRRSWRNVRTALTYPVLLVVLLAAVFLLNAVFVVPDIAKMFEEFELEFGMSTQALIWFSRAGRYVVYGAFWIVPLVLLLLSIVRLVAGKANLRRLLTAMPLIGPVWHWTGVAEFCRLLALLLDHRVQLPEALSLTAEGVSDAEVGEAAARLAAGVESGRSLSGQMAAGAGLPDSLTTLVRWGEDHGALPEALRTAAELFQERVRLRATVIKTVLPPLVFILIGVGAGFLVMGIFSPLITLIQGLT